MATQLIVTFVLAGVFFLLLWSTVQACLSTEDIMVRGVRTPLVAMLCWWEFATPIFALGSFYLSTHLDAIYPQHLDKAVLPHRELLMVLRYVLSVGGAAALWRMSRLAVPLYAARFVLFFFSSIYWYLHPAAGATPESWSALLVSYVTFAGNFAIFAWLLWWVNEITKPPTQLSDLRGLNDEKLNTDLHV
jgi:hypothetical protein